MDWEALPDEEKIAAGKACKQCGVHKPLTQYYEHAMMRDGYLKVCKACKRAYSSNFHKKQRNAGRLVAAQ